MQPEPNDYSMILTDAGLAADMYCIILTCYFTQVCSASE